MIYDDIDNDFYDDNQTINILTLRFVIIKIKLIVVFSNSD